MDIIFESKRVEVFCFESHYELTVNINKWLERTKCTAVSFEFSISKSGDTNLFSCLVVYLNTQS